MDRLIARLYEGAAQADGWPAVLEELAGAIGADAMTLVATEVDGGVLRDVSFSIGSDPRADADYRNHFAALDPWVQAGALDAPPGAVAPSESLVSVRDLERTEFYNDFYSPNGWHHGCGASLLRENGVVAVLAGHRHRNRGSFGDAGLETLQRLVPHLQSALRVRSQLDFMAAEREATSQLLDRVPIAAILVDERARIVRTNRAADDILAANDGLGSGREGLEAATGTETHALARVIADAVRGPAGHGPAVGGRLCLSRPSGGRPYFVEVTPVPAGSAAWGTRHAMAGILVSDGGQERGPDANALRVYYALTPAEANLAAQLASGLSLEDAAAARGITRNTARDQLKSVFTKTGVRRQADLVRLVLQVPRGFE